MSFESSSIVGLPTLRNGCDDFAQELLRRKVVVKIRRDEDDTMTCALGCVPLTNPLFVVCAGVRVGVVLGLRQA